VALDTTRSHKTRSFSLIEVALAAALGTAALLATMQTTGDLVDSATALEATVVADLDRALERIDRDLRAAWWVRVPKPGVLEVADARGDITRYEVNAGRLRVTRPSGVVGTLAEGLASVVFDAETVQRLRKGEPEVRDGVIHSVSPGPCDETLTLGEGSTLQVAFILPASQGQGRVPGVKETLLYAVPETLALDVGYGYWSTHTKPYGALVVSLEPGAGPGDARTRPGSTELGSRTVHSANLPQAPVDGARVPTFQDSKSVTRAWVCHDLRDETVEVDALMDHIAHGDLVGGCDGSATDIFIPPASSTPLDLSIPGASLLPGVAYNLKLAPQGQGAITVLAARRASPSARMLRSSAPGIPATPWAQTIPLELRGQMIVTTTDEIDVVATVTVTLLPSDGSGPRSVTSSVLTQVLTDDPWQGVVPGETAPSP
jgi:hypothetical protein